jgi:hypothetical protein
MNRTVITAVAKLCGEALIITVIAGIVVGIMGNLNKWDTSMKYSNAFFIAGALVIIGGLSSRMAASEDWNIYLRLGGGSFGDMSPTERANFIIEASSSLRLVIVALLSGISLMIISLLVWEMF